MKSVFAILVAILATGSVYAKEIKSGEIVTITGKLGSYTEKEDGFTITITTDDVVIVAPAAACLLSSGYLLNSFKVGPLEL